jgi:hypothetical protein
MANNRRDFFTDSVLGTVLGVINTPTQQANLSNVFKSPEQCNDTAYPYIMYGLLTERRVYGGETQGNDISSISKFTVLAYVWSTTDQSEAGLLRQQVNKVVDLIEKAIDNADLSGMQFTDTNGTVNVWNVKVDDISSVPDFGDAMAAVAVNGSIWWSK